MRAGPKPPRSHESLTLTPLEPGLPAIDQYCPEQLRALAGRMVAPCPCLPFQVPGLAMLIERENGTEGRLCEGSDATGAPIREDTLFPIASATKLATGLAILRLVDRGAIALDAEISRYLPEAQVADAGVTVRMLLSHSSGLPLEVHPSTISYDAGLTWRAIAQACLDTPLQFAPRSRVQYSNVGYGLLAQVVERIVDANFVDALEQLVIAPLEIEAYLGQADLPRAPAYIMDVASTYVGTDIEPVNSPFWRALGLPWAGLLTTIDGLLSLLKVYANSRPDLISAELVAEARSDQTVSLSGGFGTTDPFLGTEPSRPITWPRCAWGLMLELHGDKRPHWAPPAAASDSFGQIGSTGCLAWYDPVHGTAWAIMAPRTTDSGWLLRHGMALGNIALL